jgi:hypothetical protein
MNSFTRWFLMNAFALCALMILHFDQPFLVLLGALACINFAVVMFTAPER